jgi:hypothetical protein
MSLPAQRATGQIGSVPADTRPGRSIRPRPTPFGAGSGPVLLIVAGLAACVSIATATSCDTTAAANGATGNQAFVQEIATRLKAAYSMAYTAVYALGGGGTGTVAQSPATGQTAYSYPTGMLLVTSGRATVCNQTSGPRATCGGRSTVVGTTTELARGGLVRTDSVVSLLNASALNRNSVISEHDTTIAGTSATCVTVGDGGEATNEYEACVTADGLLGSFTGEVSGTPVDVMMINFTKSVSSDEFELPNATRPAVTNR